MRYTDEWHYTNRHRAVVEGLPRTTLEACGAPSRPIGGNQITKDLHKGLEKGNITIRILSKDNFDARRKHAICNGIYVPKAKKQRSDVSHPRRHRKERLFPAMAPVTTEFVEEEMENNLYCYPVRILPKGVSNVVRKRKEEAVRETAKLRRR
jgi:hypothetical protein